MPGERYLLLWSANEGMSSWLRTVGDAVAIANMSGRTLVAPCVAPDGALSCSDGIKQSKERGLTLRKEWLTLDRLVDVSRIGARIVSWTTFAEEAAKRDLFRRTRSIWCLQPLAYKRMCQVHRRAIPVPSSVQSSWSHSLIGSQLRSRLAETAAEPLLIISSASRNYLARATGQVPRPLVLTDGNIRYLGSMWEDAASLAAAMRLGGGDVPKGARAAAVAVDRNLHDQRGTLHDEKPSTWCHSWLRRGLRSCDSEYMREACGGTCTNRSNVPHHAASAGFWQSRGESATTKAAVHLHPLGAWSDAELRQWLVGSRHYHAVQWRYEGSTAPASGCARQMLSYAPSWGCTLARPCLLLSDIPFNRARQPLHRSHDASFGLGDAARRERAALGLLLDSRLFVKLDAHLADNGWAGVERVDGRVHNSILTVLDKLLAATATELVSCAEACRATPCAACSRGKWTYTANCGGCSSLFNAEIMQLRRLLGRSEPHCWHTLNVSSPLQAVL